MRFSCSPIENSLSGIGTDIMKRKLLNPQISTLYQQNRSWVTGWNIRNRIEVKARIYIEEIGVNLGSFDNLVINLWSSRLSPLVESPIRELNLLDIQGFINKKSTPVSRRGPSWERRNRTKSLWGNVSLLRGYPRHLSAPVLSLWPGRWKIYVRAEKIMRMRQGDTELGRGDLLQNGGLW